MNGLERSKKTTLANLNTIQAATVGIMGLALAAQKTIGIVGIAFGVAASLFDTTTSTVLFELPASAVASIVGAQQQYLRSNEDARLSSISNQGLAAARLNEYLHYCVPVTIETNITKVLNNATGTEAGIVTGVTTPAVTSSFVHNEPFKKVCRREGNSSNRSAPSPRARWKRWPRKCSRFLPAPIAKSKASWALWTPEIYASPIR